MISSSGIEDFKFLRCYFEKSLETVVSVFFFEGGGIVRDILLLVILLLEPVRT